MASKYKGKDAGVVASFNGSWVSWAHTVAAYSRFSPMPEIRRTASVFGLRASID